MKKAIFVFLSVLIGAVYLQAQTWSEVLAPDIKDDLNDIVLISDTELWAVGNGGVVLHTTDGFESFVEVDLGTGEDLVQAFFLDQNNGWVGSEDGTVFYTTDGGTTWSENSLLDLVPSDFSLYYFNAIEFVNQQKGFVLAGKYGFTYLFGTTDGGATWALKDSISASWSNISFYNENIGIIGGGDKGTQRYTTDGGETWALGDSVVNSPFGDCEMHWLNENEVIYIGQGLEYWGLTATIFKSSDGGKTWDDKSEQAAGIYDRPTGLYFKDATNGIAVGSNGFSMMFIFETSDGGDTWTSSVGDYSFGLIEVVGDGDLLFALGEGGHILKSENFGETWSLLNFNTPSSFESMQFVGNKGFLINEYSDFYVTTNGSDWEQTASVGLWNAGDIYFVSESVGFAAKENAGILKTTDGGSNWYYVLDPVDFSSTNMVGGLCFADEQTGYAWFTLNSYSDYRVYKTTDAGENWSQVAQMTGASYLSGGSIEFFDGSNGFMAGTSTKPDTVYLSWLKYTEDGGTTWNDADISAVPDAYKSESLYGVAKVDENTAFATGGTSLLKTTDKGKTWTYVDYNATLNDTSFYKVDFNGDYGIVATDYCEILYTDDGGDTWTVNQDYYDLYTPNSVAVTDDGKAYIGTYYGYVLAFSSSTPTGIDDKETLQNEFSLSQNYPNPFNPTTNIKFSIPEAGMVNVAVYNLIGQKVLDLANTFYQAGSHQLEIDGTKLSSGVYFYQLTAGSYQLTKKMMLIK
ncbi:MAG: YCF48-related protein [Ignavibacteria bacterium]|jgi:photosystem II stability/assembly factor-like uncharacterized protein